jgi:hypothetical protein
MKYALLVYNQPGTYEQMSEDERGRVFGEYHAVGSRSEIYGSEQLQDVETATTVRVSDGDVLTTDGPFPEAKEYLGGLYFVDAPDLDTAIEVAAQIPAARLGGGVEIRPVVEWPS